MEVEEVVTSFCVVNEPAERSVTAAGNWIGTISTKKAFQATLHTMSEFCRLSTDFKLGTFRVSIFILVQTNFEF